MSWSKKCIVSYHFLEAGDEEYFINLKSNFDILIDTGECSGSFESGDAHYVWKISNKEYILDNDMYFVSLVKERSSWPVWFNDEGEISSIPLSDGMIGELFYGYICPTKRYILTISACGGSAVGSFRKFLKEFSMDGSIKLIPLFEEKVDEKVLSWDYYKKFSTSINFPTHDDLAEFNSTTEGKLLGIVDEVGGLKFDITITAPRQKQVLNSTQLRDMVKNLLSNEFCSKLALRGADFETEIIEEYDIKNAQIKYSEVVEVSESFLSENEAKSILKRALNDRASELHNEYI